MNQNSVMFPSGIISKLSMMVLMLALLGNLSSCGRKGPLYIPQPNQPVGRHKSVDQHSRAQNTSSSSSQATSSAAAQ